MWLKRREAPGWGHAQRVIELVAFVEEMARNVRREALAGGWLEGELDFLGGATQLDEIAGGARADDAGCVRALVWRLHVGAAGYQRRGVVPVRGQLG